jgi:hypothetical protein
LPCAQTANIASAGPVNVTQAARLAAAPSWEGAMEALIEHLQRFWPGYALAGLCAVPLIYITRKYTLPFLQFLLEFVIYSCILHVVIHGIVRVAAWFQYESQMKFLEKDKVRTGWMTPLVEVWNREAYSPTWVFYFELVLAAIILFLMFRYRPMAVQKPVPKRDRLTKGKVPRTVTDSHKKRQRGRR